MKSFSRKGGTSFGNELSDLKSIKLMMAVSAKIVIRRNGRGLFEVERGHSEDSER